MIKINNKNISLITYANGETSIKINPLIIEQTNEPYITVDFRYENDSEIFYLIMTKDFIDNHNYTNKQVILRMEYIPYSRMDQGQELFTLQSFSKIINNLNFSEVQVLEPHSEVSVALFERLSVDYTSVKLALIAFRDLLGLSGYYWITCKEGREELLQKAKDKGIYIIYPDIEAYRRYDKFINYDKILLCEKIRHKQHECEVEFKILGTPIKEDCKMVVVIDDLCSRYEYFDSLAKEVNNDKTKIEQAVLCVTHCEPHILKHYDYQDGIFDKIYISDSMFNKYHIEQQLKSAGKDSETNLLQKVAIIEGSRLKQLEL